MAFVGLNKIVISINPFWINNNPFQITKMPFIGKRKNIIENPIPIFL